MSDPINLSLCLLWEDELRKAAGLLAIAEGMFATATPEQYSHAAAEAYAACCVALHGLADDRAVVMIGADTLRQTSPRSQVSASSAER